MDGSSHDGVLKVGRGVDGKAEGRGWAQEGRDVEVGQDIVISPSIIGGDTMVIEVGWGDVASNQCVKKRDARLIGSAGHLESGH